MTDPVRPPTTPSETRTIDLAVAVPGTPKEVWDAIASGPGISSWFVPHTVDGRVGGQVTMNFGSYGTHTAVVTAWEPPRRIVIESGGDRPLAYEWLVEARDGGTCIVRLVNSGFGAGEDWDGDFDGMTDGWTIFLESLRLQLTHFRGSRAEAAVPTVMVPGPHAAAWATLCDALGIGTAFGAGDRLVTGGDGVPALAGNVATTITLPRTTAYLLVLDEPVPGTAFVTAEGDGDQVAASAYLYLYGPGGREAATEWSSWLTSRFPAPAPVTG